ncbi:MAG TPA: DUF2867 domain-containing protein [Bacteroidales bacterium]|nr:DUF2867 domain-containing protein [Bacteroidales bacterium]
MMKICKLNKLPDDSLINNEIYNIDYQDTYMIAKNTMESVDEIKTRIFTLPEWIQMLLRIRYYMFVKPFGLKTGNHEIPTLFMDENEIVIGEDDRHLYFRISILKREVNSETKIYLTTIVRYNNLWGNCYFFLIKPFHKLVVKALLKRI